MRQLARAGVWKKQRRDREQAVDSRCWSSLFRLQRRARRDETNKVGCVEDAGRGKGKDKARAQLRGKENGRGSLT